MQKILDPMSGSRMFYFDKNNKSVLFGDIRDETHWTRQYKKLEIHPDQLMDARELEFPDNTFYLVVLDPPHLINCGKTSDMAKSYGVLEKAWHADMKKIFNEAWRVLKPQQQINFSSGEVSGNFVDYRLNSTAINSVYGASDTNQPEAVRVLSLVKAY